jgi:HEAT repeat protein
MLLRDLFNLVFGDRDARDHAAETLGEAKSRIAVPFLARAVTRDPHVWVRRSATYALGAIGGSRAFGLLAAALESRDWEVRAAAVAALCQLRDTRAMEPIAARLADESALVRKQVPWALVKLAGGRAVPMFSGALKDRSADVRAAALGAIAEAGDPSSLDTLVAALADEESGVRSTALRILANLRDRRALGPLVRALQEPDERAQKSVMEALERIDPRWMESGELQDALPRFVEDLASGDSQKRSAAAQLLAVVPSADPAPLVAALLRDEAALRPATVQALTLRGWAPTTTQESVAWNLARQDWDALVALGESAFGLCFMAAQDADRDRRAPAISALCHFPDPAHLARLEALLSPQWSGGVREDVFQALLESERPDIDRAALCRRHLKDEDLRHIAARRLVQIGGRENLEPLIDYLLAGGLSGKGEVITALGNTMRRDDIDRRARSAIQGCMKSLAARGDQEAAAVLWLAARGQ